MLLPDSLNGLDNLWGARKMNFARLAPVEIRWYPIVDTATLLTAVCNASSFV